MARAIVLTAMLLVLGCSKSEVPESLRGDWKQANDETKLRFEQTAEGARVSLSTFGDSWFGPLELVQRGESEWRFKIAEIVITSGNNTQRIMPAKSTKDAQYIRDQNGRVLVHKYRALTTEGDVTVVQHDAGTLRVTGLWADVEVQQWDDQGQPTKETITPVEVQFGR